jgi:c-di-AMP phosphodiesterase-like protein
MKVNDKDYKDYMDSDENVINFFDDRVDDFTLRFTNKNEKLVVVLANG